MQINTTSSLLAGNQTAQILFTRTSLSQTNASSFNKQDNRDELLRGANTNEYRAGKSNIVERVIDRPRATSTDNKQLVTSNNDYLPASVSNQHRSSARVVNPVNTLAVFSRNAIVAYETTSRLEENNQLTQVLGFDAFA